MRYFLFSLPAGWAHTHPPRENPREPVRFCLEVPRESWLWLSLRDWEPLWDPDDPEED